uniref:Uncharacterized protein n=1 Tax=Arion vulgaris TaxID=1028688 RepID=A0A0B7A0R9_9EUPU
MNLEENKISFLHRIFVLLTMVVRDYELRRKQTIRNDVNMYIVESSKKPVQIKRNHTH